MPIELSAVLREVEAAAARGSETLRIQHNLLGRLRAFYQPGYDVAGFLRRLADLRSTDGPELGALASVDGSEVPNAHMDAGAEPKHYSLLACDGSQVMPDRHKPVLYGMVQAATVCIAYGVSAMQQAAAEAAHMREHKFYGADTLIENGEVINPGTLSNERDLLEIEVLARACRLMRGAGMQPVALVDGSIVPFVLLADRLPAKQSEDMVKRVANALDTMRDCETWLLGYIDRPTSNTLIKAVAACIDDQPAPRSLQTSLGQLNDVDLLRDDLHCGKRSALFDPGWGSKSVQKLAGQGHGMRACYANVGEVFPYIARFELPQWCVPHLPVLHAIVQRQALASVGDPYPFVLKAAHEAAVITKDDQGELDNMVLRAHQAAGLRVGASAKQSAKDLR